MELKYVYNVNNVKVLFTYVRKSLADIFRGINIFGVLNIASYFPVFQCNSLNIFFTDTRSMSELVRPSCSEVERCVHTAVKSVDSQEQVTEHYSSMAASCQSCYDPLSQEPLFRSVSELGRRWCKFYRRCYHRERYRNFNFTIVSYNVLADGLLQSNSHLYTGTEEWLKSWEYRKRNLLQELLFYDADVSV